MAALEQPFEEKEAMIKAAITQKQKLQIVYLKSKDEKSKRVIKPRCLGEMEYLGKKYRGVEAFCLKQQARRVFRLDHILSVQKLS